MSYQTISLIVPLYNEIDALKQWLPRLTENLDLCSAEIILIDDGSNDGSSDYIREFSENNSHIKINLIAHSVNRGYGAALVSGIKAATRSHVVWMDADGQHHLSDVKRVADMLANTSVDFCIGNRSRDSYKNSSRIIGKYILSKLVNWVAQQRIDDFNSGLRGFRKAVLNHYLHLFPRGFGASTITTLLMIECGYQGRFVDITVTPRIGKSSVRQIRDGLRTIFLILRILLLFRPMQFFGWFGLTMMIAGLGYGLPVAFIVHKGFPVLAALVILFGAQSLFFGLLCDQISGLHRNRLDS